MDSGHKTSTGCTNENNRLAKKSVFQQWQLEIQLNFQNLHFRIHTTHAANFIEITGMVQKIQLFKLSSSLFQVNINCAFHRPTQE